MTGRYQLVAIICAMGVALGIFIGGFRQIAQFRPGTGRLVWSLRFGAGALGVAKERGLDGKEYGPLALTVSRQGSEPTLWIADTYHYRLLQVQASSARSVTVPQSFLEDVCLASDNRVLLANNQGAQVLKVVGDQAQLAIPRRAEAPGYTTAIWSLTTDGGSGLWVEWVRIGRGSIHSQVDHYTLAGRDVREQVLDSRSVGWIAASPNHQLYIQPLWSGRGPLWVHVYTAQGRRIRTLALHIPPGDESAQLLGVDARGNLYVDLGRANVIRVFTAGGAVSANIRVPSSPIHAWIPGYVEPDGTLYLMDSTMSRFRVLRYRWHQRRRWRWQMP